MSAILTAKDIAGVRCVVVDCEHGTTTAGMMPGNAHGVTEQELAQLALLEHFSREGCRCTKRLRRRYGVTP